MSSNVVYAIVKAGGRQEKVSVGDVVVVDTLELISSRIRNRDPASKLPRAF